MAFTALPQTFEPAYVSHHCLDIHIGEHIGPATEQSIWFSSHQNPLGIPDVPSTAEHSYVGYQLNKWVKNLYTLSYCTLFRIDHVLCTNTVSIFLQVEIRLQQKGARIQVERVTS